MTPAELRGVQQFSETMPDLRAHSLPQRTRLHFEIRKRRLST